MTLSVDPVPLRHSLAAQRQLIDEAIRVALSAVDPREAIFRRVQRVGHMLMIADRAIDLRAADRVLLVSIGKAAVPMADALIDLLGDDLSAGVVVTKYGHAAGFEPPLAVQVVEGGHPVPDERSIAGARTIETILRAATSRDVLLCAISGGGSALVTLPIEGVPLADLQATTDMLLRSGATIHELNAVRKHVDWFKGGGLARMSQGADAIALLLSDVVGDDLSVIASGPTAPDPSTFQDAWRVVEQYRLAGVIPASVRAHLQAGLRGDVPDTPKPGDPAFERVRNVIVGSNRAAAEAAQQFLHSRGLNTMLLSTFLEGEAREVGRVASAIAREIVTSDRPVARPAALIAGGETTVTVRGSGAGGRNQELALSAAIGIDGLDDVWVVTLATDGADGPTGAAGAIVNGGTMACARRAGIDAGRRLAENDSHGFFNALSAAGDAACGGLIVTGPTGTNVNDLLFVLAL